MLPLIAALSAAAALLAAPAQAADGPPPRPPKPVPLKGGWEVRDLPTPGWQPARVPGVFDPVPRPEDYNGEVKLYRLRFEAPDVEGFRWALRFEQVRRKATVHLNGRRIGISIDPYNAFEIPARGLRPGRVNTLTVRVDSRKDPRLPEGWWNWGGITRPVSLVPLGPVHLHDLGLMPDVQCRGPATGCTGTLLVDGMLSAIPAGAEPRMSIRLRAPSGRVTERFHALRGSRSRRTRSRIQLAVPAPELWSPEKPQLYRARVAIELADRTVQVERLRIGMRSVDVRDGMLLLNNRPVNLRGASIHEDFPGHGAALTPRDMDTIVRELEQLGANVTRAHYVLSEPLLRRLDRAGILVYNQAPIWQRDRNRKLRRPIDRKRAVAQVERTVIAARSHPSVIVHAVANELAFAPDRRPDTPRFVAAAEAVARDLDPVLPIAIDLKTPVPLTRQETYASFDVIGVNQYYGWYSWNPELAPLEAFMWQMRSYYPDAAIVMTELGAEGRPDLADAPPDVKGGYAFQTAHVARTMEIVDRLPWLSGAIHWTLREFEIYPGWRGGAIPGESPNGNTRHHKGVLTYTGERKPAWGVLRDHIARTPLYR